MESRSLCGATATGPVVRMHPDRASAVMVAVIDNRNARATRTGAIPESETALVLHRLWLTKGFYGPFGALDSSPASGLDETAPIRQRRRHRSGTTHRCRPIRNSPPDSWQDI